MTIGHVMLDLQSVDLNPIEKEMLRHPQVGGVILFSRNYDSKQQLAELIHQIRSITPHSLIAVDQEGGRVQRFRKEFLSLPAFKTYGELYEMNPTVAIKYAEKIGTSMASELIAVGIDLSFTPVLDVDNGVSEIIGDRSFHHDISIIIDLARAFIRGMHRVGMPATGKHFPGHGAVAADSHNSLPVDDRTYEMIFEKDLQPFLVLQNELDAIMPAHILYKNVDANPTCFSSFWLQDVLRSRLNFKGVIFSDDLSMAGAEFITDYKLRAEKALESGCDMILICNHQEQASRVLEHLENYVNPVSQRRLINFKNSELTQIDQ